MSPKTVAKLLPAMEISVSPRLLWSGLITITRLQEPRDARANVFAMRSRASRWWGTVMPEMCRCGKAPTAAFEIADRKSDLPVNGAGAGCASSAASQRDVRYSAASNNLMRAILAEARGTKKVSHRSPPFPSFAWRDIPAVRCDFKRNDRLRAGLR